MDIQSAFAYCEELARTHYENFPIASLLIPKEQRPYIATIYAYARTADDFADEGTIVPAERLRKLDEWEARLDDCYAGKAEHPVFVALAETIARTGIPRGPFVALLEAFREDVTRRRFMDFAELLDYCEKSADPVGQLVLYVFGEAHEESIAHSNSLCTGLQLANFWQDVAVDLAKGRIYIPLEDFDRFGYTESDLGRRIVDARFKELIRFEVERTHGFFREGEPLLRKVGRSLRMELAVTLGGGRAILRKIKRSGYDVLTRRPTLSLADKLAIVSAAVVRGTV